MTSYQFVRPWGFNRQQHRCTVTITRLGATGVQGSVACMPIAVGTVPRSDLTFTAAP